MADPDPTPSRFTIHERRAWADRRGVGPHVATVRAAPRAAAGSRPADADTIARVSSLVESVTCELGAAADPVVEKVLRLFLTRLHALPTTDYRQAALTQLGILNRTLDTGQALAEVAGFWRTAAKSAVISLEQYADTDVRARYALQQLRQAEDEWQVRVKRRRAERQLLKVRTRPLRLVLAKGSA